MLPLLFWIGLLEVRNDDNRPMAQSDERPPLSGMPPHGPMPDRARWHRRCLLAQ
jgi:hypothetical protein